MKALGPFNQLKVHSFQKFQIIRCVNLVHPYTSVNYEYLFYWYLQQDGTIEFEIKLTVR